MSAISLIQFSARLRNEPLQAGIVDSILHLDEFTALVPFINLGATDTYAYNREKALPGVAWLAPGASTNVHTGIALGRVTTYIKSLNVDIPMNTVQNLAAGGTDVVIPKVISKAAKALGFEIAKQLVSGDSSYSMTLNADSTLAVAGGISVTAVGPNHDPRYGVGTLKFVTASNTVFYRAPGDWDYGTGTVIGTNASGKVVSVNPDHWVTVTRGATAIAADGYAVLTLGASSTNTLDGLIKLVDSTQTITAGTSGGTGGNGANLSFADLDFLEKKVKDRSGPKIYVMSDRTINAFEALMRTAGGIRPVDLGQAGFGSSFNGMMWPRSYKGIPVLMNDFLPTNRAVGSSGSVCAPVFCMTLGEQAGVCGFYAEDTKTSYPNASLLATAPPGIKMWDLGLQISADASTVRAMAYLGLANENLRGLAMLDGVLN